MTTTQQPVAVTIDEPVKPAFMRHPTDLLRVVIAVAATLIGFLLATVLNNVSEAITVEVIDGFDSLPDPVVVVVILVVSLLNLLFPVVAIGYLLIKRMWRRLGVGVLASGIAIALLALIENFVVDRFAPPSLTFTPPTWICAPDAAFEATFSCVPGSETGIITVVWITAIVAFYATVSPLLNRRWRVFFWGTIAVLITVRMLASLEPPLEEFLAIGLAYAVGATVVLIGGERDRRPRGGAIADALARSGIELSEIRKADVDARGSVPYLAVDADGRRLFIKLLTPEERSADVLFRMMRMFRLKGVGDERPFSSLKREAEHEAVVALKANADGVRTPTMAAVAEIPPHAVVIAYEMIEGSSLDGVVAEELSDEVLQRVWHQVAILRERRTAHRDLRLANVFLAADGDPWLIDFGFAELAATDGQLRSDVAELVMSTATVVGAERAVANGIAGIGPDAVAEASARVQPLALSGATRAALKQHKGLDDDVRSEIERQTGVEGVELEDLERVKTKWVLMALGLGLAFYFLIPQLAQTDFGAVLDADWLWLPAILAASFVTYVGAAYNVIGSVPDAVKVIPSVIAQFAGTFINRITPVKVGGMATNVRFLQKNGVDLPVAVSGIGISSVSTFIVHMTLLAVTVVFLGRNLGNFVSLPSGNTVLVGLVVVFTLSGLVVFLPFGRKIFKTKVWPMIRRSAQGLVQIAGDPWKAMMLFGGALTMILAYIAALWFSLAAFGGGLGIAAVALVFLGGQALGNLAPTPGGIGATEAAMIAAFTALGLEASVAVPTVFLYRICTFWLPILPGIWALRKLENDGLL
jgi:glycosyltransferase 2 family protein